MTGVGTVSAETEHMELVKRLGGRVMTADEAAALIRPGDRMMIPIGASPVSLGDAVAARIASLDGTEGVEIGHAAVTAAYPWLSEDFPGVSKVVHEHWTGMSARPQMKHARHDFLPMPFSLRFRADGDPYRPEADVRRADVVLVQGSLPDRHGYVYFGAQAWNQVRFMDNARDVIAELSPIVTKCFGIEQAVHISRFSAVVITEGQERAFLAPEPTEVHRKMAAHLSELVHDGDTIQIGAGAPAMGVVAAGWLSDRQDLGWHSESTAGQVIELIRRGVINSSRKTRDRGVAISNSYHGSPEQVEFVELNPAIQARPTEYVHNINVLSSIDNMVALNCALMVDLTGQVAADSVGHQMIGGTGGQLEFVLGAANSKNGRSITLLEATSLGGSTSRICSSLPPGTVVSVPRMFTDIVVTEYGIARLWGKTLRERARELISIAAPEFREELARDAKEYFG